MSSIIKRCYLAWGAVLLATLCSWTIISAWLVSDPGLRGLLPPKIYSPPSSDWIVATGQVDIGDGGIHILGPGESGETLLLLNIARPIEMAQLGHVVVHFSGQLDSLPFLIWSAQPQFQVSGMEPFVLNEAGMVSVDFSAIPNGSDQIYFLGIYQSGLSDPWTINSLALHPKQPNFFEFQSMVLSRFLAHRPWQQQDIKFSFDQPFGLRMSFTPVIMIWVICCALILFVIQRSHPIVWRQSVVVLILGAWVLLDLRWFHELTLRMQADPVALSEETGHTEQPIEEMDSVLMSFANQLRNNFSARDFNRIFALGGDFEAYRLRYHMSDWSVRALVPDQLPNRWANRLQPDDLVLVVDPWDIVIRPTSSTGLADSWVEVVSHDGVFLFTGEALVSDNGLWAIRIGQDHGTRPSAPSLGSQ